jgi:hypothetical protein
MCSNFFFSVKSCSAICNQRTTFNVKIPPSANQRTTFNIYSKLIKGQLQWTLSFGFNLPWTASSLTNNILTACCILSELLILWRNGQVVRFRTMDQIAVKTPNPRCLLYLCLIEFIDWRYSQSCWYFRPLL